MAIKVNGTTVVDDSRVLSNVTGLKTINSTSILGSGDIAAGASTTLGDVGTYGLFSDTGMTSGAGGASGFKVYKEGRTAAGSALVPRAAIAQNAANTTRGVATSTSGTSAGFGAQATNGYSNSGEVSSNQSYSGSWRMLSPGANQSNETSTGWGQKYTALWVRYS